ncbi:MAG: hypothetical protein P1S46_11760 [bacterium]|nr:hypothetical protein [bacterium]
MERSEVPDCDECDAYEENPRDYAILEICPECPWGQVVQNPLLDKMVRYLGLLDAGAPVGRWELTDEEWSILGALKLEREKVAAERMRENHGDTE